MSYGSRRTPFVPAALIALAVAATQFAAWCLPVVFEPLRSLASDRLFQLRAQRELGPAYDGTVVNVAIDDADIRALDHFYFDRADHARLIRGLGRAGVAAQLHDVIFGAAQDPSVDDDLASALEQASNAYLGMALGITHAAPAEPSAPDPELQPILEAQRWRLNLRGNPDSLLRATRHFMSFASVAAAARGHGFLDIAADRDGVFRKAPLIVRDGDGYLPSLPFRIVCDYLGVAPQQIEVVLGSTVTLRGARRPGSAAPTDIVIPIDEQARIVVNYLGPWGRMTNYPSTTVREAMEDRFTMMDLREALEGKIAIISWIATGSGDIGAVPTDPTFPLSGIHANVINGILAGEFLRELSTLETAFWFQLPLMGLLLLAAWRCSTVPFVALGLFLIPLHLAAAAWAFSRNLIVDVPGPVIALVASIIVVAAYQFHVESKARAVLRSTFDAFFAPAVIDKIMAHPAGLVNNAQKKELTILFSDIKSFTTHTSRMEAGHVRDLLNEYFERMIEIVFRFDGTLDKFIGDGLMVFFGDPQDQPDHAERCVRAAIAMQKAARELDKDWSDRGDMPLAIRIGINSGRVIVGNMGSERRVSYTVLGEPVNLAQRLESGAPVGGILISRRTRELLGDALPVRHVAPILVKGIAEPIDVFEVPLDG